MSDAKENQVPPPVSNEQIMQKLLSLEKKIEDFREGNKRNAEKLFEYMKYHFLAIKTRLEMGFYTKRARVIAF